MPSTVLQTAHRHGDMRQSGGLTTARQQMLWPHQSVEQGRFSPLSTHMGRRLARARASAPTRPSCTSGSTSADLRSSWSCSTCVYNERQPPLETQRPSTLAPQLLPHPEGCVLWVVTRARQHHLPANVVTWSFPWSSRQGCGQTEEWTRKCLCWRVAQLSRSTALSFAGLDTNHSNILRPSVKRGMDW